MRGSLGGRLCCLKRRLHPRERTLLRVLSLIKGHLRGPSCPRWGRVNATSDRWDESWFSFQEGPAEEGGEYHPQTTITGAIFGSSWARTTECRLQWPRISQLTRPWVRTGPI